MLRLSAVTSPLATFDDMNPIKTHCRSRQGNEVVPVAFAAGSDNDSVWAFRTSDNALRCYYVTEVLLPDGVAHVSAILPSLKPMNKAEAQAEVSIRAKAMAQSVDLNSRRASIVYGEAMVRELRGMGCEETANAYARHYGYFSSEGARV